MSFPSSDYSLPNSLIIFGSANPVVFFSRQHLFDTQISAAPPVKYFVNEHDDQMGTKSNHCSSTNKLPAGLGSAPVGERIPGGLLGPAAPPIARKAAVIASSKPPSSRSYIDQNTLRPAAIISGVISISLAVFNIASS